MLTYFRAAAIAAAAEDCRTLRISHRLCTSERICTTLNSAIMLNYVHPKTSSSCSDERSFIVDPRCLRTFEMISIPDFSPKFTTFFSK